LFYIHRLDGGERLDQGEPYLEAENIIDVVHGILKASERGKDGASHTLDGWRSGLQTNHRLDTTGIRLLSSSKGGEDLVGLVLLIMGQGLRGREVTEEIIELRVAGFGDLRAIRG
jgi:hypothetical protein